MRRLLLSLSLAALAVGAVGVPASAGSTVRMVDDDGRAGIGNCGGSAAAATKIQQAIDASGPGDTVLVCPGTYREQPVIKAAHDGLTLRSVSTRKATIRPPDALPRDAIVTIRSGAEGVTVRGFVLRFRVDDLPVAGITTCGLFAGVRVDGPDALISTNTIRADGAGTTSRCGMAYGVALGENGPGSAVVEFTIVRDFTDAGIAVGGDGTRLDAVRNIIRFHHASAVGPTSSARRVAAPRQRTWSGRAARPAGQFPLESVGITVFDTASATIVENIVEGSQPGRGPLSNDDYLYLAEGIEVDSTGVSSVRRNRVFRAYTNILIQVTARTAALPPTVRVRDNVVLSGITGISVYTDGAVIRDNQASGNAYGLFAGAATIGNTFRDNDARYNLDTDCTDLTSGDAVTVDNDWTNNLGWTSNPDDLCANPL